jgi:hypothetical protein
MTTDMRDAEPATALTYTLRRDSHGELVLLCGAAANVCSARNALGHSASKAMTWQPWCSATVDHVLHSAAQTHETTRR